MNTTIFPEAAGEAVASADGRAEAGEAGAAADATHAPPPVDIRLDDRPHRVAAGTTLAALVEALGHRPADVASAVNGAFVPRAARAGRVLEGGDAVLLFKPIVGG